MSGWTREVFTAHCGIRRPEGPRCRQKGLMCGWWFRLEGWQLRAAGSPVGILNGALACVDLELRESAHGARPGAWLFGFGALLGSGRTFGTAVETRELARAKRTG